MTEKEEIETRCESENVSLLEIKLPWIMEKSGARKSGSVTNGDAGGTLAAVAVNITSKVRDCQRSPTVMLSVENDVEMLV